VGLGRSSVLGKVLRQLGVDLMVGGHTGTMLGLE
jgi:hypothetical protein